MEATGDEQEAERVYEESAEKRRPEDLPTEERRT
jgi:hypothetical protein